MIVSMKNYDSYDTKSMVFNDNGIMKYYYVSRKESKLHYLKKI